jgi:hypothetical protein
MTTRETLVPWTVVGALLVEFAAAALPQPARPDAGFDLSAFGRLPVWVNGRVQPMSSVARTALQQIRGPLPAPAGGPEARPAAIDPTLWLLEVLARPDAADARPVFPVGDRELLGALGLRATGPGTNYHAFDELRPQAAEIHRRLRSIESVKPSDRTPGQLELIALRDKLTLYERLKNSLEPNTRLQQEAAGRPITFDFGAALAGYQADLAEALRVDGARRRGGAERLDVATELRLRRFAALFQVVARTGLLAVVPPPDAAGASGRRDGRWSGRRSGRWRDIGSAIVESAQGRQPPPPVAFFAGMSSAFAQGKPDVFNGQVAQSRRWLADGRMASEVSQAGAAARPDR